MTSTAKKTPGDCETMAELRAEIDALDKELVSLLALRSDFIDRAVTLKTRENLPPRITWPHRRSYRQCARQRGGERAGP